MTDSVRRDPIPRRALRVDLVNSDDDGPRHGKVSRIAFESAGLRFTVPAGLWLEYDVFLEGAPAAVGAVDLRFDDGTSLTDLPGLMDDMGIHGQPQSDLGHAANRWMRRRIAIPAAATGKNVVGWQFHSRNGIPGYRSVALFARLVLVDAAGRVLLTGWDDGQPVTRDDQSIGISSYEVTVADISPALAHERDRLVDALRLRVQNGGQPPVPPFTYAKVETRSAAVVFSELPVVVMAGDVLEYEISHREFGLRPGAGIDIEFDDGSLARDSGWTDHLGLSGHPGTNLQRFSAGSWYRRRIALPDSLVGKRVARWMLVSETDEPDAFATIRFREVRIVNGLDLRATLYESGHPAVNRLHSRRGNILAVLDVEPSAGFAEPRARIAETRFSSADLAIAEFDVTDFGTAGDGLTDDTAAFSDAVAAAERAGGAVVFAPAGRYLLAGQLILPEGVTLRGDWRSPSEGQTVGTILCTTAEHGEAQGHPFISLYGSAAVRDLVIWHPNQAADNIVAYPPTIRATYLDHAAVENVTLINSFVGVECGPSFNELATVHNMHATALDVGISCDSMPDIPRLETIVISPDVWADSGLPGAPASDAARTALADHTRTRARGIVWGRVDLGYVYGARLSSLHVGIDFVNEPYGETGARFRGGAANVADVHIDDCTVGIRFDAASMVWGVTVSDSSVTTPARPGAVGVLATSRFASHAGFNACIFDGFGGATVLTAAPGALSFHGCQFIGETLGEAPIIEASDGSVSIVGCNFPSASRHLRTTEGVRSVARSGNHFAGSPSEGGGIEAEPAAHRTPDQVDVVGREYRHHHYRSGQPSPAQSTLFALSAAQYADRSSDFTLVLQAKLDEAAAAGGGTVFLRSGSYRIDGVLTVPPGVELRGSFDTSHHTAAPGTVLLATAGRGNPDGTPFLTLQQSSGVRGLTIHHPNQSYVAIEPYPWTIRVAGEHAWVVDVSMSNAYRGVEIGGNGSADDHYIRGLNGCFLDEGIVVDESRRGWLENVHANPHYWFRSHFRGRPASEILTDWFPTLYRYMATHLTAITLGSCGFEHLLNVFTYGSSTALELREQEGAAPHAVGYNVGLDSIRLGIAAHAIAPEGLDLVGLTFYAVRPDPTRAFVRMDAAPGAGKLRLVNVGSGDTNSSVAIAIELLSGDLLMEQWFLNTSPEVAQFHIDSGKARFDATVSFQPAVIGLAGGGHATVVAGTFTGDADLRRSNAVDIESVTRV